ncbi:MAG: YopX family protein [Acidobacteriia bacterium]|nr:YopX family protein [Terriglobia bacterium]
MGEIKFRACAKKHGKRFPEDGFRYWSVFELPVSIVKETVGQFTGLKNKNGKEIYEGDILEWEAKPRPGRGTIEWGRQADQARWIVVREKSTWNLSALADRHIIERIDAEVIGNIYENPKLLKE